MISYGQAVKGYLHCSDTDVQAVSLKGSLSVSHWHVSCLKKKKKEGGFASANNTFSFVVSYQDLTEA